MLGFKTGDSGFRGRGCCCLMRMEDLQLLGLALEAFMEATGHAGAMMSGSGLVIPYPTLLPSGLLEDLARTTIRPWSVHV